METNSSLDKKEEKKMQIKENDNFKNIKSDYFLIKVFLNIRKKRILSIIKYNKLAQNRLNININDYENYCHTYSPIELELVPAEGKFGNFINVFDFLGIHIFFNGSNEEIKRNYFTEKDKVKIIKIIIDYNIDNLCDYFKNCLCIESVAFKKFYRNNIFSLNCLFFMCSSLKEVTFSNCYFNNISCMNGMFYGCSSLKKINILNSKASNINEVSGMFYGCSSLKELNLSNFNTNNVNNMCGMFYGCSALKELNLSNFNTNSVNNMSGMFCGCSSLKELNLYNFNTNNVYNMRYMFYGCSS